MRRKNNIFTLHEFQHGRNFIPYFRPQIRDFPEASENDGEIPFAVVNVKARAAQMLFLKEAQYVDGRGNFSPGDIYE